MFYAALVAPSGQLTDLPISGTNVSIFAVALNNLAPASMSSSWAAANTQLSASFALHSHLSRKKREGAPRGYQDRQVGYLAYAEDEYDDIAYFDEEDDEYFDEDDELAYVDTTAVAPKANKMQRSNIWLAPFGNYVRQTKQGKNPGVDNSIGGFLLGYDYDLDDMLFGAAVGYAYDYLSFGSGWGRGSLQEEMLSFYGRYERDYLKVNFALWGGLYQLYSNRNGFFSLFSSTSNTHGWIFSPYLEIGLPIPITQRDGYYVEPFVRCDYVNNWPHGFTEKGPSGFNLIIKDHYSSVLRSEAGSSFFQQYDLKRGSLLFKQKISYVNQMPFHVPTLIL